MGAIFIYTNPGKYLNILRLPRVVKQLAKSATRCATVASRHCLQLVRLLTARARHAQYYNRVFPARVEKISWYLVVTGLPSDQR